MEQTKISPTILIGLGSSGLAVVDYVQKLMYENLGKNSLPIFSYIYVETDESKDVETTPQGSDIREVRIGIPSIDGAINVLSKKKEVKLDWIPNKEKLSAKEASIVVGAGGNRELGRLSLWAVIILTESAVK
jgi:hypothetical protein